MLCSRTGIDYNVPLPNAKNLVEISNSILSIQCSLEFENLVMMSMEGNRAIRFISDWWVNEEFIDHKNVIFIELSQRMSAIDFGNVIKEYGDVQVIKDGEKRFYIEFQWVDDIKYPQCRRA